MREAVSLRVSGSSHGVWPGQQYHDAGFKTSVFFLQNRKGAEKWPVTEARVMKVIDAFRKWE